MRKTTNTHTHVRTQHMCPRLEKITNSHTHTNIRAFFTSTSVRKRRRKLQARTQINPHIHPCAIVVPTMRTRAHQHERGNSPEHACMFGVGEPGAYLMQFLLSFSAVSPMPPCWDRSSTMLVTPASVMRFPFTFRVWTQCVGGSVTTRSSRHSSLHR